MSSPTTLMSSLGSVVGLVAQGMTSTSLPSLYNSEPKVYKPLHPFSAVASLALITLYPVNTKIGRCEHSVSFDLPGSMQGYNRLGRASRKDLQTFSLPLISAVVWYRDNPKIKIVFDKACTGLGMQSGIYIGDEGVVRAISSLEEIVKGKLPKGNCRDPEDQGRCFSPKDQRFKGVWPTDEIDKVCDLFLNQEYEADSMRAQKIFSSIQTNDNRFANAFNTILTIPIAEFQNDSNES